MLELIEELSTASTLLSVALDRYLGACLAIQTHYTKTTLAGVTQALSESIGNELLLVKSYETGIKQAKSIISRAKNCSTVASIHSIPTEVLVRIFHLVVGTRPCNIDVGDNSGNITSLPRYPDFLSHVCARWRQVTMGLPELWSHIDIVNFHSLSQGSVTRSEACLARAADLPLDIHVRVPASYDFCYESTLRDFLASVATRIRSLELTIPETPDDFDQSILECCFNKCVPGTFTQLIISDSSGEAPTFIEAAEDEDEVELNSLWLQLPYQCFEDILQSVTVLWLDGVYPLWTSRAYHGLVELRLTCARTPKLHLAKLDLYKVLVHNPKLRILEFGLEITDALEGLTSDAAPLVYLGDLEVLNLGSLDYDQLKIVLGLLDLGSKPLHLTMRYQLKKPLSSHTDAVVKFLKRSNITRMWVKALGPHPKVGDIVNLLPRLRVLALDGILDPNRTSLPTSQQPNTTPTSFSLDALYILGSYLPLDHIQKAIKKHPVRRLVFWRSTIFRQITSLDDEDIKDALSGLCPVVEFVDNKKSSPAKDWD